MNPRKPWPLILVLPMPLFIALLIGGAYAYAYALHYLPVLAGHSWFVIGLLNSLLALLTLLLWKPHTPPSSSFSITERRIAWLLAPAVLIGTGLLAGLALDGAIHAQYPYSLIEILALGIGIPLVEEIIFRRFLSSWIALRLDGLWSVYVSGLVFALAHTNPPLSPWPPLGPFLLGGACAWVYRISGRLLPAVLLHAACNLSAIVFATYATSWLDRLSWLYQKL